MIFHGIGLYMAVKAHVLDIRFYEQGASLQTENLWVRCDSCGAARNMAQASGMAGRQICQVAEAGTHT